MAVRSASTPEAGSRAHPLAPYVPRLLAAWSPTAHDPRHMRVTGSLAFVDISGFTQLTERLARKGKVGAEEMSDTLSATFAALLTVARGDDADLVKWGGDAVLLLFHGPDHAARAARSAYRMRHALRTAGRVGTTSGAVTLRMSVGIHSGDLDFFLVGDPAIHRELVISGPGASATAEMEAAAAAGQIGLSAQTAALLPARLLGAGLGGGRLLRSQPPLDDLVVLPRQAGLDPASALPPPIRARLLAGAVQPEHRTIAVAFVQFSGTDALMAADGPAALAQALDDVVRNVQGACAEYDVTFFESDINRDGGKIMLTAGAPHSAGHDEERMLRVARLVMDRAGRLPLRIGVNRGRVFSGDFGPDFRRTFSVKGDAVNLAARVMAKAAPGQVLATTQVVERSATVFRTVQLAPFMVKGKSMPIHAAEVGEIVGSRRDDRIEMPLVGRAEELATLRAALDGARARTGTLVEVVGEPGIGKSRLVEELLADAADVVVVTAPCEEYESSTAYFPFRRLLREVLGIAPDSDSATVAARLTDRVAANAAHLLDWVPLLGVPLDVDLPPTTATRELDEQFRKPRLEAVVCELLEWVLPTPTVLVFDDAHLMDDASADLLRRLASQLDRSPWLVLVTRRDLEAGFVPRAQDHPVTVRPAPLPPEAALTLLHAALDEHPLPAQAVAAMAARAGGNPMFLEALVREAARSGSVAELPESVEGLVTSQIDRLDPEDRAVLRYAAVLGTVVDEDLLVGLLDEHAQRPREGALHRLSGFLLRERSGRLRFRHALMRDVAYEGLPFSRRRVLHDQVGSRIEGGTAAPESHCELLSLHFFHAGRYKKAWHYSVLAGERALEKYANGEAIDFFRRAVESARQCGDVEPTRLAQVLERLGDALFLVGLSQDAVAAYARARRHVRADPVRVATIIEKEVRVDQRLRRFPTSLRRISIALRGLGDRGDSPARVARSLLARRYAFSRYNQGRVDDALHWAETAAREAEDAVDTETLALAYTMLSFVHTSSGRPEPLPYTELALRAYTELGKLAPQAHCLNNLAVQAFTAGRWEHALRLYREAREIFARIGDTASEANVMYNEVELLVRQGRVAEAGALLPDTIRLARVVQDDELLALAMRERARVVAASGRLDEAIALLEQTRARFETLDEPPEVLATQVALATVLLDHGRPQEAAVVLERISADSGPDRAAADPAVALAAGRLARSRGDRAQAREHLEHGLALAERENRRYEQAVLLAELALLLREVAAPGAEQADRAATGLLRSLGIVTSARTSG